MAKIKRTQAQICVDHFSCLSDGQIIEMDWMINSRSMSYRAIAEHIQNEWEHYTNLAPRTFTDRIYGYNRHVLKPKLLIQVGDVDVYKELLAIKNKIDVLREFAIIISQQKERVNRSLKTERMASDGKNFIHAANQSRRDIKLMADLLDKLARIQLETGILKKAPRVISGEFKRNNDDDPANITFRIDKNFMDNLDKIEGELRDVVDFEEIEQSLH